MKKKCCKTCKWFKRGDKYNTDDCIWAQKNPLPEVIALTCLCTDDSIGVDCEEGIKQMRLRKSELIELNPSNGWGNYESALKYLERIHTACLSHPKATLAVNW